MCSEWPAERWFGSDTLLIVDLITNCHADLAATESPLALGVSAARLRELKAGRAAAHHGLLAFNCDEHSILMSETGAPIWPKGYCGSISHNQKHVCALISRTDAYVSVGVDLDDPRPIGAAAMTYVASRSEVQLAGLTIGASGDELDRVVFCIKEAAFKCFSSVLGHTNFQLRDTRLLLEKSSASLVVRLHQARFGTKETGTLSAAVHIFEINDAKIVFVLLPSGTHRECLIF